MELSDLTVSMIDCPDSILIGLILVVQIDSYIFEAAIIWWVLCQILQNGLSPSFYQANWFLWHSRVSELRATGALTPDEIWLASEVLLSRHLSLHSTSSAEFWKIHKRHSSFDFTAKSINKKLLLFYLNTTVAVHPQTEGHQANVTNQQYSFLSTTQAAW